MFQIDLQQSSKPGSTSSQGPSAERLATVRPFVPVLAGLAALVIGLGIVDRRLDGEVAEKRDNVTNLESSLASSKQQLAELSGKTRVLYESGQQDIYWSDELRMISEKLSDKLWLTQVHSKPPEVIKGPDGEQVTKPGGVIVEGGVLSSASEGNLDVIGKLVADLQADPRFQQSFASVTLDSVQRSPDPLALTFSLRLAAKS